MFANPSEGERCELLRRVKTIAVVGLSPNPARPSNGVARAMQQFGYGIIPVRPGVVSVLGERAYPDLASIPQPFDLVNVFRNAQHLDEVVDQCLAVGAKALWIQEGIVDEQAAERARATGMTVVMDRCIYRDYVKLCGQNLLNAAKIH